MVFPGHYRVFHSFDQQTNCLGGDRQGLCDVWRKINSATFVTEEQNTISLCPVEDPTNLDAVRIRYLSVWGLQPHMYPRSVPPSDV